VLEPSWFDWFGSEIEAGALTGADAGSRTAESDLWQLGDDAMTWVVNTGSRYHTQDTGYYCGAACAMMILAEIGVPYAQLDQDVLYASNNSHNAKAGWATDPYGLRFTLVDRRPPGFTNTFVVHKRLAEADGTVDVLYTLRVYGVSPAILVFHCQHWNIVVGAQTSGDPLAGPYGIDGLWLNNPVWFDGSPPPPHSGSDLCGSGGAHGLASQFVTHATWQTDYFNGCAYDDPGGATQFISVCDPDERNIERPLPPKLRPRGNGRRFLARGPVTQIASGEIKRLKLHESELAAPVLRSGRFAAPQLVMRLDRPDSYYFLLPWGTGARVAGFAQVDALYGIFNSFQLLSAPSQWLMADRDVRRRIENKRIELAGDRGVVRIRPGTYCISPTLVWRPCRESFSPHLPFWQVTAGNTHVYVRIDGAVFGGLTTTGKGV
jgi:hypothetical protein